MIQDEQNLYIRWVNSAVPHTSSIVEDTNATITAVVDLVELQRWIAVGLDPNAGHGIVEDLVLLDDAEATVINEDSTILSAPDLVVLDQWIASGPEQQTGQKS